MRAGDFTKCLLCRKGMLHNHMPFFLHVRIEYHAMHIGAVQRQAGMEMAFGPVAAVLGPDEDLTRTISEGTGLLCGDCMMRLTVPFALLEAMTAAEVPA